MPRQLDPAKLSDTGRRILALAARRGLANPKAIAEATGFDYRQLLDIIKGRKATRITTLIRVAGLLGGTLADLYAPPEPPPLPKRRRPRSA